MGRGALQPVPSSWDCWAAIPHCVRKLAALARCEPGRKGCCLLASRCAAPAFPGFCWSASSVSLGQLVMWVEIGPGLHLFFFLSFLTSSFWVLCPPRNQPSAYEMRTLHLVSMGVYGADGPCLSLTAVRMGRSSDSQPEAVHPPGDTFSVGIHFFFVTSKGSKLLAPGG